MQAIIDSYMTHNSIGEGWTQLLYLIGATVGIFLPFFYSLIFAGIFIFLERRIASRTQSRIGPNRVGPNGWFQWVADALKVLFKEDLIPDSADGPLYRLGPLLAVLGVMAGFAVVPWGGALIGADLNVGLLYLLSITSLVVCGVLMSGWASNSKWALFGGMRSAAQIVSYEIPHAVALLIVVMLTGSMSILDIGSAQGWLPVDWFIVHSPFALGAFLIYCVSALAEGSRIPFDLPEAESELVAGYNTEYSGWRFLLFYLAELANVWVMAVLAVMAFLGGGNIPVMWWTEMPWYTTATPQLISSLALDSSSFWALTGLSFFTIFTKTWFVAFVISQLRWTLPRFRVDQMMTLCWKYLVPLSFAALLGVMVVMRFLPMVDTGAVWQTRGGGEVASWMMRVAMLGLCGWVIWWYLKRIAFSIRSARDRVFVKFAL